MFRKSDIPQNNSCTTTNLPSQKPSTLKGQDMRDTSGEVRMNSRATFICRPLHTDDQVCTTSLNLYTTVLYGHRM